MLQSRNPSKPLQFVTQQLTSPYNITAWLILQVMRVKEMITKDDMS